MPVAGWFPRSLPGEIAAFQPDAALAALCEGTCEGI